MFLHKIVLATVRIENKKYTSLVVPLYINHMRQKVKSHGTKSQKYVCKNQKTTYYCDDEITSIFQSA